MHLEQGLLHLQAQRCVAVWWGFLHLCQCAGACFLAVLTSKAGAGGSDAAKAHSCTGLLSALHTRQVREPASV